MTGAEPRRWGRAETSHHLRAPERTSDKYRRGVLGVRTGSTAYPGAAVLGVEAAWRTGIGLVRYTPPLGDLEPSMGLPTPAAAVLAARPETVFVDSGHLPRCDAWILGSGTDPAQRSFAEREMLHALMSGNKPLIVDAGALTEILETTVHAPAVLTPHRGEFISLWRGLGFGDLPPGWSEAQDPSPETDSLLTAAGTVAEKLNVTVLLKGPLTVTATPGGFRAVSGPATPWLATAGTGDVLAGILGSLVASYSARVREDSELLGPLAASAAVLHDVAARIAAGDTSRSDLSRPDARKADPREPDAREIDAYKPDTDKHTDDQGRSGWHDQGPGLGKPITALDVAHALPDAVAQLSRTV